MIIEPKTLSARGALVEISEFNILLNLVKNSSTKVRLNTLDTLSHLPLPEQGWIRVLELIRQELQEASSFENKVSLLQIGTWIPYGFDAEVEARRIEVDSYSRAKLLDAVKEMRDYYTKREEYDRDWANSQAPGFVLFSESEQTALKSQLQSEIALTASALKHWDPLENPLDIAIENPVLSTLLFQYATKKPYYDVGLISNLLKHIERLENFRPDIYGLYAEYLECLKDWINDRSSYYGETGGRWFQLHRGDEDSFGWRSWHIAWTVSRGGLRGLISALAVHLTAYNETRQIAALALIADSADYTLQRSAAIFGGGQRPHRLDPNWASLLWSQNATYYELAVENDEGERNIPSERDQPAKVAPRYTNAVLFDKEEDNRIDPKMPIEPGSALRLRLDIGAYSPESAVTRPEPLPEHLLPRDIWLDVMVSSSDFTIGASQFEARSSTTAHGRFFLPGDGSPARTENGELYLYFDLVAPLTSTTAHGRIGYYYRNHLVQSQLLTAQVGGQEGGYRIDIDYILTQSLLDIADLPARQQISILTNCNGDNHQIVIRPGDSNGNIIGQACTYRLKEETIGPIVDGLREVLRDRVATGREKQRSKNDLEADLRQLAPLGRRLWSLTVAQCLQEIYPSLIKDEQVVIHVSRPTTADYTFPWSLIYDIPLSEDPRKWKLCPLVEKWDDRDHGNNMVIPGSRRCPKASGPNGRHERDTLCPFGFWGYLYDIEQLSSTDKPTLTIPIPSNAAFPITVGLTQYDIDLAELSKHIQALKAMLQQAFPLVTFTEGKDLQTIQQLMGQDEPFIYFFCHGEHDQYGDPNTYLGVGKCEKIRAQDFQDWVQEWLVNNGRKVWDQIRPLIFINACHSVEIQPKTLVSYLDAFITTGHAAGVIGTEVKVRPSVAMDIAFEFSRLFFGGKTVGEALHLLRTDYLSYGNLYGLIYTPYCWSNLVIVKV
jgi:hypothetical protein